VAGDTVNTAARMCKFSNSGTIRVTQGIGADARVSTSGYFKSVSQGLVLIKGKGQMEVYDVSLNEPDAFCGRQSASRVAVTRTRIARQPSSLSEPWAAESVEGGSNEAREMAQEAAQLQAFDKVAAARLMAQEEMQWQAWLEQRHTLSRFLPKFSNTETEKAYQKFKSSCFVQRQAWRMGILFHLVSTAWQWSVITLPDQGPIFHHYGNPELIWRMNMTQALLAGQFIVSIALSCLAFFLLGNIRMGITTVREFFIRHRRISDPEQLIQSDEVSNSMNLRKKPQSTISLSKQTIFLCNVLYVMLKILNLAFMLWLGFVWPSRITQGVQFSLYSMTGYLVSHSIFGVSFVSNIVLVLLNLSATFVFTSLSMVNEQRNVVILTVLANVACVCASRFVGSLHRIMWSREQFFSDQLQDMHNHLVDLVPPLYVKKLMVGCRHIECSPGRVAVLQLDICNFTVISTSLHPTKLADIINSLVSDFDKYVVKHKLTKIDTM
jgi:antibiotic biosynthesis monooxygenase (ABM) superfamily enzyme